LKLGKHSLLVSASVILAVACSAGCAAAAANSTNGDSQRQSGRHQNASEAPSFWTRCSLDLKVSVVEVSPVEVSHLTCAQAKHAIKTAHILLSPGGPIFSASGYTCRSSNILPPVDPSPIQLPATERCVGPSQSKFSFIWDWN
jgi:curli biogenesis system outer membrane secretion channel CsgG